MVLAKSKLPIRFTGCTEVGRCFRCMYSELCAEQGPPKNCAGLMAKQLPDLRLFQEDAFENNYSVLDVELFTYLLSTEKDLTTDVYIPTGGHLSKSWGMLRKGRILKPLKVRTLHEKFSKRYHLRVSEWGCDIARIISKIDHQALVEKYNLEISDRLQKIGNVIHTICLRQDAEEFRQNQILELLNLEPTSREEYCEVTMYYETRHGHRLKGHTDGIFTFGDDYLICIDYKRAMDTPYTKESKKRQIITYPLGFNQMLGENFKWVGGILFMRSYVPFAEDFSGKYRLQRCRPHISKNHPDCVAIAKWVDGEWLRTYDEQSQLLHDRRYFLEFRNKKEATDRGCFNVDTDLWCFSKPVCDVLTNLVRGDARRTLVDVIDDEKVGCSWWEAPNT